MELVVHLGEVLLHFIELHAFHVDPGVLLTVCNAGLQAHIQVGVRDGSGGSAHCLEGHVNGLHAVGAHLQALQVRRSLDGVLGVGELAVAACIAQVDDDGSGLTLGLSAHLLCQIALQQCRDLCAGVGEEGQGEHQQTGAEVELTAAHALHGAGHDLLQHLLLGAQLAVAVNFDLHVAVGGLCHIGSELLHGNEAGVALGLCVTHGHGEVAQRSKLVLTGCSSAGGSAGGCCSRCSGSGCAGAAAGCQSTCSCHCAGHLQEIATRDLFHNLLPPCFRAALPAGALAKLWQTLYTAFCCIHIVTEILYSYKSQTPPTW